MEHTYEAHVNALRRSANCEMALKETRPLKLRPAVLDLIGNTPMIQVTRLDTGCARCS